MNEKDLRYIEGNALTSYMNRTKWRELANGLTSNSDFEPEVSVKFLREGDASGLAFLDWEWLKHGDSSCIEWIEISPIKRERLGKLISDREVDFSEFVLSILRSFNIPFSRNGSNYRVWGYANSANQPKNA